MGNMVTYSNILMHSYSMLDSGLCSLNNAYNGSVLSISLAIETRMDFC